MHDLFCEQIQRLTDEGRRGYMLSVKQVYNSLVSFNKHLDICFSDIDVCFLRRYETWLRKHGLAENTIGIRFRTLRAIYNLAMEENIADSENYPFKKYKVARLHEETGKTLPIQRGHRPYSCLQVHTTAICDSLLTYSAFYILLWRNQLHRYCQPHPLQTS